ncbi:hypothetical protein M427DRAFT_155787 [Gonapodya prolifera JEL478]|uniref:Uncharacterized protein n=1 Tax=Gonapodya prolifera (strain JEL478) TaxID=1344416 RepID=A0A139ACX2_GONPJ|nr:hypothetical protein M427DRAFT_155787 [Gonapodya prolifera JEL478]|eukprot:KXS14662.1 hypothetical protein M427DRAFT_155787 [Gonapodya prolifera JEL478]
MQQQQLTPRTSHKKSPSVPDVPLSDRNPPRTRRGSLTTNTALQHVDDPSHRHLRSADDDIDEPTLPNVLGSLSEEELRENYFTLCAGLSIAQDPTGSLPPHIVENLERKLGAYMSEIDRRAAEEHRGRQGQEERQARPLPPRAGVQRPSFRPPQERERSRSSSLDSLQGDLLDVPRWSDRWPRVDSGMSLSSVGGVDVPRAIEVLDKYSSTAFQHTTSLSNSLAHVEDASASSAPLNSTNEPKNVPPQSSPYTDEASTVSEPPNSTQLEYILRRQPPSLILPAPVSIQTTISTPSLTPARPTSSADLWSRLVQQDQPPSIAHAHGHTHTSHSTSESLNGTTAPHPPPRSILKRPTRPAAAPRPRSTRSARRVVIASPAPTLSPTAADIPILAAHARLFDEKGVWAQVPVFEVSMTRREDGGGEAGSFPLRTEEGEDIGDECFGVNVRGDWEQESSTYSDTEYGETSPCSGSEGADSAGSSSWEIESFGSGRVSGRSSLPPAPGATREDVSHVYSHTEARSELPETTPYPPLPPPVSTAAAATRSPNPFLRPRSLSPLPPPLSPTAVVEARFQDQGSYPPRSTSPLPSRAIPAAPRIMEVLSRDNRGDDPQEPLPRRVDSLHGRVGRHVPGSKQPLPAPDLEMQTKMLGGELGPIGKLRRFDSLVHRWGSLTRGRGGVGEMRGKMQAGGIRQT